MRTSIKIIVTACFLAAIAYSLVPVRVGGKATEAKLKASTDAKAEAAKRVPAHHLAPAKVPEPTLPAGFQSPCAGAQEHALPLPSSVPPAQFVSFEQTVLAFLQRGEYKTLKWCQDKGVRDTGPYKDGVYYGTLRPCGFSIRRRRCNG